MKLIYTKKQDLSKQEALLALYIKHCKTVIDSQDYESPEASLCLLTDKRIIEEVMEMVRKKKTPELKYVIVIGIGGSNLGTKAIYEALSGQIKMFFLDTIDPKAIITFLQFVDREVKSKNEFIISIISKSGGTTEPLVNAEILLGHIKKRFSNWNERCVIITNPNSALSLEGKRLEIDILEMPIKVGGRYSVFSAVGLFPLMMAGIDVTSLLKGAVDMRNNCISESSENYARSSSILQFLYWKQGRGIHNSFFFHPELESLGKWYRQLMGESIGKDKKGITPLVSIGSVDHHSMVQLYWGGPADKTTEMVYSIKTEECPIPDEALFPSLNTFQGKETSEIMAAIQKGTVKAYEKQNEPYFEVVLDEINEYELGAYMQYKMMEIMYLAHLMQINAFDQPQVELYKVETKNILTKKDI